MPLTFKQAREILSQYASRGGVCPDDPRVALFVRSVLEYLLISGHYGNLRKFCFCAVNGCFTVPYELETPLKVRIDGKVGSVWDKWFEFHESRTLEECIPAGNFLIEDPNQYATAYEVPDGGRRIGVLGVCQEDPSARIIVQGIDPTGREIITAHNGQQISGEYLSIEKGNVKYTQAVFGKITGIVKSKTNGYVQLLWIDQCNNQKGFLSDYSPLEEAPSYRRFLITTKRGEKYTKVSILGRIRLKEAYADTDYIPFNTVYTLQLAGQAVNANFNTDPALAKAKDQMMTDMIERENSHKRINNGQPLEFFLPTSAGAIKNIIGN